MKSFLVFLFIATYTFCFSQIQSQSIGFIENKGQIVDQKGRKNNAVKYLLNTAGLNVQLRKNGFSYDVYETKKHPLTKKQKQEMFPSSPLMNEDTLKNPNYTLEYIYHRIDVDFKNSNATVTLIAEDKSTDYDNYYNIPNEPNGILNVYKYQKIAYKNIYNNIDVVFFIPNDKSKPVEYNFIVKPNGKIEDIKLEFKGVKTELADNKIKMNVRFGIMEETLPISWVEDGNVKKKVAIGYTKISKNIYGFKGNLKSSNKTIVIDPVPIRLWGTYYGGGYHVSKTSTTKTDNNDNVIFSGLTYSSNNVGTAGAFQSTGIPLWETGFLAKMNSTGNRIWGTYIKNNIYEARIHDLITNSSNEIYAVGYTWDQDGLTNTITTSGAFREFGGPFSREGILLKFDENGQRIWGTFYGGAGFDEINTINLDSNENLIIAGQTNSSSGISTSNSYLTANPNSSFYNLGFFAKFDSNGNRTYGSYYQGIITYCTIDSNDYVYFAGQYRESNEYTNISTQNAHQTACINTDVFLVKFNSSFNREWCTYYGGNEFTSSSGNSDKVTGLGSDISNNVYIIGTTSSSNNIATLGSFKDNQTFGGIDAFIVKFNSSGLRQWGTYFGGNNIIFPETAESGFVSDEGNIYVAGNSRNYNELIATPNSFQPIPDGSDECFFSKFDTNGNLVWCSYYGTPSQDYSSNIYYKDNKVYLLGYSTAIATNGNDLGTPGTHMPTGGGFFLGKFQDCQSNPTTSSNTPTCIGSTLSLSAAGGTNYSWTGPNGFTSNIQNPIISNANSSHSGQYTCTISGTGGCDGTQIINVFVGDNLKPVPTTNPLPIINGDCNTIVSTIPTATDNCAGTIPGTTTDPLTYSLPGSYTINWSYTDANGNTETQNQTVVISDVALPTTTSPQTFCIQQNATINTIVITGQNIKWYDGQTGGNLLSTTTILQNGITYYASQTIDACESTRVPVFIIINNTFAPAGSNIQTFCATQNPTLNDVIVTGTSINWYGSVSNSSPLPLTTTLVDGVTYFASQTENGCESVSRLVVSIGLLTTLNAVDYSIMVCDIGNDNNELIDLSQFNANLVPVSGNTFTYYKSDNGAENQLVLEQLTTNHTINLGLNTIYVRIDSVNGCHQIVTLRLTLVSVPIITVADEVVLCENRNVTVNAGISFSSYAWSTGATTSSIVITQAGNYSVTVTKNNSGVVCSSIKNFTVVLSNAPIITSIETIDWTDTENSITINLNSNSIGDYEYSIDGINYQTSSVFNGLPNGSYLLYVRDRKDCGTDTEQVFLLNYPKYFTPNGDGYHDTWRIRFSQFEPNFEVRIFDRYGKLLKIMNNQEGWDGNYNGSQLPSDDYWFVVTRNDGRIHKGHFALKR